VTVRILPLPTRNDQNGASSNYPAARVAPMPAKPTMTVPSISPPYRFTGITHNATAAFARSTSPPSPTRHQRRSPNHHPHLLSELATFAAIVDPTRVTRRSGRPRCPMAETLAALRSAAVLAAWPAVALPIAVDRRPAAAAIFGEASPTLDRGQEPLPSNLGSKRRGGRPARDYDFDQLELSGGLECRCDRCAQASRISRRDSAACWSQ